ncbi:MAG: type IV secretion system protein [Proteobacteria bacterium]|nr:type IV secretion system protein [Pseudomonadota bacterium]
MMIKLLKYCKCLTILWAMLLLYPTIGSTDQCISAGDFGTGGTVTVYANPARDAQTPLLRDTPANAQISPWIDTGTFTSEQALFSQNGISGYVEGGWYPWGFDSVNLLNAPECDLSICNPNSSRDVICMTDGKKIYYNGGYCKETQGYALYGLIAFSDTGQAADPNQLGNALALSNTTFRTFRIGPLQPMADGSKYFQIPATKYYDIDVNGNFTTVTDTQANGQSGFKSGKLYLKIVDNYYGDNEGSYNVTLVGGVYTAQGFVSETIEMVQTVLQNVQEAIFKSVVSNPRFVITVRAVLLLYVCISAFLFMAGLMKMHQAEIIIRLLKFAFITIIISPDSWDFFNTYVFDFFQGGAQNIADLISKATVYSASADGQPAFLIPEGSSVTLSVYDLIVKMLTSSPFHIKIWALLFTDRVYFIPLIYICVVFMLLGVMKSILIYLLALINMALLLIIGPFFIVMVLFSLTRNMFDDWLKQLIATAMMMIFIATTLALMVKLIVGNMQQMLFYKVCWQTVVISGQALRLDLFDTEIINIKFWQIMDPSQVTASLTFQNLVSFLLVSILFYTFVEQVPALVDTLSGAARRPMSELYSGAIQQFDKSRAGKLLEKAMVEPSARVGAQRELLGKRAGKAIEKKLAGDSEGMRAGIAKMVGGMVESTISKTITSPGTIYRTGQSLSQMAADQTDTSPTIFTGGEKEGFVDYGKALQKPDKPRYSLSEAIREHQRKKGDDDDD